MWRIFEYSRNLFLIFFSAYKTETAKQVRDSCLKIYKYSRFLTSRFRQIAFLMTCQQHKYLILSRKILKFRATFWPRAFWDETQSAQYSVMNTEIFEAPSFFFIRGITMFFYATKVTFFQKVRCEILKY